MRIALVSQAFPPETARGGIGRQAELKAHGLSELGHEVFVVSCATGPEPTRWRDGDVEVIRLAHPSHGQPIATESLRWLAWSVRVAEALHSLHAEVGLDVVDVAEYGAEGYAWLLDGAPVPTAVHVHGPLAMLAETIGWPEAGSDLDRVGREMEGTCLRRADLVYASASCSAGWCERAYGLDADAIEVLHLGVDLDAFRPGLSPRREAPTVLYVGALAANKGVFDLLEAVLALPDATVRMIGTGEPHVEAELRRRAAAAGRPEALELAGYVGAEDLPPELCAGHVLALPSRYEGGPGLVLLEAMACGLPVVACSGSGAAEVVDDGVTGHLVAPGDPATLAATLGGLLVLEPARAAMGARAREYVEVEADTLACAARLAELFERTAAACPS